MIVLLLCTFDLLASYGQVALSVVYLSIFSLLFGLLLWSFVRTLLTSPGTVECDTLTAPIAAGRQAAASQQPSPGTVIVYPSPILCSICRCLKPERSHHCSLCNRCILKMDHHCPWINNCVGFANYKFFILFLFYSVLLTGFCTGVLIGRAAFLRSELGWWDSRSVQYLVTLCITGMFFLSNSFLLVYHLRLLSRNRTTLESTTFGKESLRSYFMQQGVPPEQYPRNIFDMGGKENFLQVFGESSFLWLLPIATTPGSGKEFPKKQPINAP